MKRILVLLLALTAHARAQGTPAFDPSTCGKVTPPSPAGGDGTAPPPVTWNGFEVEGRLRDDAAMVRTLLAPTLERHRALTDAAREDLARITNAFGYHLVELTTRDTPSGVHAVVHLAPMPMVRRIAVDIDQGWFDTLLEDEVRRRMRVRVGAYLPWPPTERACDLYEEERRIQEFLRDEGFIDAKVTITQSKNDLAVTLTIKVRLGSAYTTGIVNIAPRDPDGVGDDEIQKKFRHPAHCLPAEIYCWGRLASSARSTSSTSSRSPSCSTGAGFRRCAVRTDFDPVTSFDRRTKRVNVTVTIDTRRQLDVRFEGYNEDSVTDEQLRKQLTFDQAASSDYVEADDFGEEPHRVPPGPRLLRRARDLVAERFEKLDRLVYRIDQGQTRRVKKMEFVGNHRLDSDTLGAAIGVEARTSTTLFGDTTATTSEQLAIDVEQLHEIYRRAGYRDARITVSAATDPAALGSAAMTAALLVAGRGDGLYIRYTIDEGPPTLLSEIHVDLGADGDAVTTPDQRALCDQLLKAIGDIYGDARLARPSGPERCLASAPDLAFRESDALDMRDRLKDRLFGLGRPRAKVAYAATEIGPHRYAAHYTLSDVQPLRIGKVVIRGNFRTQTSIIEGELRLARGHAVDQGCARRRRAAAAQHQPVRYRQRRAPRSREHLGRHGQRGRRGRRALRRARARRRRGRLLDLQRRVLQAAAGVQEPVRPRHLARSRRHDRLRRERGVQQQPQAPPARRRGDAAVPAVAHPLVAGRVPDRAHRLPPPAGHRRGSA